MKYLAPVLLLLLLSACSSETTLEDRVVDRPGELLYHDVFLEQVPADDISVFGVALGSTEEQVIELHGEPDLETEYVFGRLNNIEYAFGAEESVVLYHLDKGVVTGILVTAAANDYLQGETVLDHSLSELFGLLGNPSKVQHLHLEQAYHFDDMGYEVYIKKKSDRVYFRQPVEQDSVACVQIVTHAVDPVSGDCYEFPNPCVIPATWDIVDGCSDSQDENSPPQILFE